MTFAFNSRETYKTYRAEWKADYLKVVEKTRQLKAEFKDAARAVSKLELTMARDAWGGLKPNSEWYSALAKLDNLRNQRFAIRNEANELLTELQHAKQEAHRQWLEAKQAKTAEEITEFENGS